jgi:hypothetical protein
MSYSLFIDDLRYPIEDRWVIVRSSQEAIDYVIANGPPAEISFDHDLGGDDTSMQFIKWLIEYTIDSDIEFPKQFFVHSANPVGAENIKHLMNNFIKFKYGPNHE